MDFAVLPPEVNSGLMYAGPGATPMLAASAAWDGLAAELHSAATAYESVISALVTESWLGASSAVMAAAAAPYAGWLAGTATQAEQTANQARSAAAAYEAAFGMTVPPVVIAANRAQLMVLVATNVFGQNTPAIATTEAHYLQMWEQDAVAMYGYAGAATAAAQLTPFTAPPNPVNPTGSTGQIVALAHAAGVGTATAMAAAALPAQDAAAPSLATLIPTAALAVGSTTAAVNPSIAGAAWNAAATNSRILVGNTEGILNNGAELHVMETEILDILHGVQMPGGLSSAIWVVPGFGGGTSPLSAGLGHAVSVGKLSVPLNWAVATPEIRTAAYALPTAGVAVTALAETPTSAFSQMALAGMGGSALAGSVKPGRPDAAAAAFGARVKAATGEPAEAAPEPPESPVAELVAGIRQLSELRDSGLLTATEFDEQKQRLLRRPLQ